MKKQLLFTGLLSLGLFTSSLMAQRSNNYLLVSARLDGAQQVPLNLSPAVGVGGFMLNPTRDTMCVNVSVNNLSGAITGAHIHDGILGVSGGIVVDLTPFVKGNRIVGSITGSVLTKELVTKMSTGMSYINIHTAANQGGEIRGQLGLESDWGFTAKLDGAQQNPAITTTAFGLAVFKLSKDRTKLKVNFVGHNLSGPIQGAHLHKGAIGQNGIVIADLMQVGIANNFSSELDPTAYLVDLLAGNVYINIHTAANSGGEIRGQVKLETDLVFDAKLSGAEQNPALRVSAIGLGSVTIDHAMSSLRYEIVATGLTGAITSAHLHVGAKGTNGSIAVDLTTGINGNKISGTITGMSLTKSLMAKIFAGEVYINVHTAANQGGEIRGQVNRYLRNGYSLSLDGMSQVPPVISTATGAGIVSIDSDNKNLHYMVVVSGLKSKLTGAHFHNGLAAETGAVIYDLSSFFAKTGTSDAAFGYLKDAAFKSDDVRKFSKDSVYINLHNADFANGEIRGQVINGAPCFNLPIPTAVDEKNNALSALEIAPNPTAGLVELKFQSTLTGNATVSVSDLMGKVLFTEKMNINSNTNSYPLNMSEMISGVYVIKVQIGENNIVKRVVKN